MLIILFVSLRLLSAQTLEVQEFVFVGGETPDYISADPLLIDQMVDILSSGLRSRTEFDDIKFRDPEMLKYRNSNSNWQAGFESVPNDVRPRRNGNEAYFASAVCFFKLTTMVVDKDPPWEVEAYHLTFKTKVLVLDKTSKKVYRGSSNLQAKILPNCRRIGDTSIDKADFVQLMATGLREAFLKKKSKRERILLTCGRSIQLEERLARLDSFEVRRHADQLTAYNSKDTFYHLQLNLGKWYAAPSNWYFDLDITSEANQKGVLRDRTNNRQYDLIVSTEDKEKLIDSEGVSSTNQPAVTYFLEGRPVKQFYVMPTGSVKGTWEGGTVVVGYDHDGLVNYYIDSKWVALSKHVYKEENEFSIDAFYHERSLPPDQREQLIHALLAFELGQAIYSIGEGDE